MGKLENKVAIITGSGRGLGRGFALEFAKEGAAIVVNDIDESADEVVQEIKSNGGKAVAVKAGVGTKKVAEQMVDTAVSEFGKLDVLVNNAGVLRDKMMHKMSEADWDDVLTIHLKAPFLNSQAAVIYMKNNNVKGRIINITSSAGIYGNIGQANYSAAKAGLLGLTKSNAKELVKAGICVNAIAPAAQTRLTDSMPKNIREMFYKQLAATSTIQRMGQPEDVAPTAIFLASDDSYFVTGQIICAMGATGQI